MIIFLLLISILPFERHPFWSNAAGNLTVVKYIGGAGLLYAFFYRLMRGTVPSYLGTWPARLYLTFFGFVILSYTNGGAAFSWVSSPILMQASAFLLFVLVPAIVDTVKRLRGTLLVSVGSMGWASLYVIREWQKSRAWETGSRLFWVAGDSNYFAISAVLVIPLAWYMSQEKRPMLERLFCLGCMLLTLAATLLGASRGGFLGLVMALGVVSWHSRRRFRNLALASFILITFNICYPYSPLHRLLHPSFGDQISETAHQAQIYAAMGMMRDHPLGGIGLGNFKGTMLRYAPAGYAAAPNIMHNAYLGVAAEMGIPAGLVFASLLVSTLLSMERVRRLRTAPALVKQAAVGLQAGLAGAMVSISFLYSLDQKELWFTLFLCMSLPALSQTVAHKCARGVPAVGHPLFADLPTARTA